MISSFIHSLFSIEYGSHRSVLHKNQACSGLKSKKRVNIYILPLAFDVFVCNKPFMLLREE